VTADRCVLHPESPAQLNRLSEIARRHAHIVAVGPEPLDHRAHHQDVRAVREIYPDAHTRTDGNDLRP
jgi:RNase P/RNase MRP subunit p30